MEKEGDLQTAETCFRTALEIFLQIGLPGYARDALAGLARCYLAGGKLPDALEAAGQIWEDLSVQGAAGMEFPILAYLTCARIYLASGDQGTARQIVAKGRTELNERAEKISDPEWRSVYLTNVPEHRRLEALDNLIAHEFTGGNQ